MRIEDEELLLSPRSKRTHPPIKHIKKRPLKKRNGALFAFNMRAEKDLDTAAKITAVLYQKSLVEQAQLSPNKFAARLYPVLSKIKGNRSVIALGPPASSPRRRPISVRVETEDGPKDLPRGTDLGMAIVYEEMQVDSSEMTIADCNNPCLAVLKTPPKEKRQILRVTPDLLDKSFVERKAGSNRGVGGIPDQQQVMVQTGFNKKQASATVIANLLKIARPGELWEWLHLIAFMILGKNAQTVSNLTGGTFHANTNMLVGESVLVDLLRSYGLDEVTLDVRVIEDPGTHMAKHINYTIKTKYFDIPFVFDARARSKPSARNAVYINAFLDILFKLTMDKIYGQVQNSEENVAPNPSVVTDSGLLFWDSPKKEIVHCAPPNSPDSAILGEQVLTSL